jgi:soluble lytic murein transglycosylase-like protein
MIRYAPAVWLFTASLLLAEDPYAARWSELRRRIAGGGDVSQLLRQCGSKQPVAAREESVTKPDAGFRRSPSDLGAKPRLESGRDKVRVAACEAGVHPSLALAIVERETGFDNRARGQKGEIGAGQIMPTTASTFGFDLDRLAADYDYNVRSAVTILRYLLDYFGGDEQATIRGYNGGPGWRTANPPTMSKIESYAASVRELRSKYVSVTCG